MAIAQGVSKQTRFKRQSAKGTLAGASAGQVMRRESSTFELQKETYDTASEITSTQQMVSSRHGVKQIAGAIQGILSPGTYSDLIAAVLRRDFAAVTSITGASITIAGSGPSYTVTRAAGSFLTDGIKIGMVVRLTAGSFNAANLNKNLLVTNVTATVLTVLVVNGVALVAEGPIASATVSVPGKVTYTPATGHTNIYYTFEEWYPDITVSERFQDVKVSSADLSLPGSGNAAISMSLVGLDMTKDTTVYYTSPTAETTTESLVAASGILQVNGVSQAVVTDLSFTIDGQEQPANGVVGSNVRPDVFRGKVMVTGSFTCYFESGTIPDLFINETDISILSALANGATAAADFMTIYLPKLNLNSSTPDDGETGLTRTYNFTAEYNSAGGAAVATQQTTIQIQDSQAA
jgi:hypothetical protein